MASAESQALALSYGVEPKSAMLAQLASGFDFDDRSGALAEVPAYEVVVIYLPRKHMPCESLRMALGMCTSAAMRRTSSLGRSPMGNIRWFSCS